MTSLRRRTLLRSTALAGATAIAGCLGDNTDYVDAWSDVERIKLGATANRWIGIEPEPIAGTQNPTLRLVHGRRYELEWVNQDGEEHVFLVRNHEDDTIYESDTVTQEDETAAVGIDAVAGVSYYTCPHYEVTMTGDIEIFST